MLTKPSPKLLIVIFIAMFSLILLSSKWLAGARIDLSENGLYTLSAGTEKILQGLDQAVSIDFYFSDKASTQLPALRTYAQRVEELLREYESMSNGKLSVTKVDPVPFSEAEDEAALAGLQGVPAGARGDEIYFGLVAKNDQGAEEVIAFMQPDREAFLEYELTRLISSLSKSALPKVGIFSSIEINGGYDFTTRQSRPAWSMLQFIEESFDLEWIDAKARKIEDIDVLILVAPQNLSTELTFAIDQFVMAGGRTLIFLDPYAETLASMSGMPSVQRSDLAALLPAWGVKLREQEFLTDYENSMVVGVGPSRNPVRHIGLLGMNQAAMSSDDIVLFGLESLNWSSAGILEPVADAGATLTPLVVSSQQAQPRDVELLLQLENPQSLLSDFAPTGEQYILAARLEGQARTNFPDGVEVEVVVEPTVAEGDDTAVAEIETSPESIPMEHLKPEYLTTDTLQLIVVSDSDVLSDRLWVQVQNFFGQQIVTPWADNGSFLVNSLENLSGHPDLIEIRSQGRFNRPFVKVDALRRQAEERFLAQQELLEEELQATESKLLELEQIRGEGEGEMFTPEQEAELLDFQTEKLKIRKQLRDVQHQLDQDIENLGTQLKLVNILLIPGLICGILLLAVARRRFT